jgi:signal transduction histidine kinase
MWACLIATNGLLVGFYLMSKGYRNFARLNILFVSCIAISGADLVFQFNSFAELYYFPAGLLAFIIFEASEEKWIFVSTSIPLLFWIGPRYFNIIIENHHLLSTSEVGLIKFFNTFGAYGLTMYFATFFIRSFDQIEKKLIVANKFSALGEMAAGVAHEINNPLTIISLKTNSLKKMLNAKNFSRTSDADSFVKYNLAEIVNETIDLCMDKIKTNEIRLSVSDLEPRYVICRPIQIFQVLINLMSNSIDAIKNSEDPWIEVLLYVNENKMACVSVKDCGNGIPIEIQQKMMNPFFTTKEVGSGTGLGLSVSHGIMESHSGSLRYDSHSENTCFILEIPLF